jgi:hypothetical protein
MSMGHTKIQIPTPDIVLNINADVVNMYMPLLIGLDVLDRYRLQMLTIESILQQTHVPGHGRSRQMGIRRKNGHVYLNILVTTDNIFYSELDLQKLHPHLYHPSARIFYEVLHRADPGKLNSDILRALESINKLATCARNTQVCRNRSRSGLTIMLFSESFAWTWNISISAICLCLS